MANNYSGFSERIEGLTSEQRVWLQKEYDALAERSMESDEPCCDFELIVEADGDVFIVSGDEYGNAEHVVGLIQPFLQHFDLDLRFGLTWAEWCDKRRPTEFGGGAMVVSKNDVQYMNVWDWKERHVQDPENQED